uniref:Uncharacterized protein n=1 Tax=Anguilla anguilla TaxID=7936 RepID=A0A0E9V8K7_ANGAN
MIDSPARLSLGYLLLN